VHVGRRYLYQPSWAIHCHGALTAFSIDQLITTSAMDYRFNMTPRLIAIAVIGFISLMALLFALGFQLGLQWGADEARLQKAAIAPHPYNAAAPMTAMPAVPSAPAMPAVPAMPAAPTLPSVGVAVSPPVVNPTVTIGRSN